MPTKSLQSSLHDARPRSNSGLDCQASRDAVSTQSENVPFPECVRGAIARRIDFCDCGAGPTRSLRVVGQIEIERRLRLLSLMLSDLEPIGESCSHPLGRRKGSRATLGSSPRPHDRPIVWRGP